MKKLITLFTLFCASFGFSQVPSFVPTNGLVAWWPFNGNANDESGNGHNGTIYGNVATTTDRLGSNNSAYQWNGNSNNYISIGYLQSNLTNQITISVWVLLDCTLGNHRIISTGEMGLMAYTVQGNQIQLKASYDSIGGVWPSNYFMDKNVWHHIVFTASKTDNVSKFYVDGVMTDIVYGASSSNYSSFIWNIGRKSTSNYDSFCGKIDDVGIWNRALTTSEVQQLYSGQLSAKETSKSLDVKFYPNPVGNILTLSSDETISKVLVYNTAGQLVLVKDYNSKSVSLDMPQLTAGNYLIKVEGKSKTNEFKIIKK